MCLVYQTPLFTTHWFNRPHTFNWGLTCHRSPRSLRSSRSKSTRTLWSTSPCLCGAYIQTSPLLSCVWKGMMVRFRSVSVQSFEAARTEGTDCCSCARDRQRVCLCALRSAPPLESRGLERRVGALLCVSLSLHSLWTSAAPNKERRERLFHIHHIITYIL